MLLRCRESTNSFKRLTRFTVIAAVVSLAAATIGRVSAQKAPDTASLELGMPMERELAGGQAHTYNISLRPGQYLHLTVDQQGIDVVVTLLGPDGRKAMEIDSPNGMQGLENVMFLSEIEGIYTVEVRAFEPGAASGHYQINIAELRMAAMQDTSRIQAQQALADGRVLWNEGSPNSLRKAINSFEVAVRLLHETGDRALEAETLTMIGLIYNDLREYRKAIDFYYQALPVSRAAGDRRSEAVTLSQIGSIYDSLGQTQKALDYYLEALPLRRLTHDQRGEGVTLQKIGSAYYMLGEKQKAFDSFNQALILVRAIGDRRDEGYILNGIGLVYGSREELQKALDDFTQAQGHLRAVGDQGGEAMAVTNMSAVYEVMGENQKALEYLNQAILLQRAAGDPGGEATSLNKIGSIYKKLGDVSKALEYYQQALTFLHASGDRVGEIKTLINIAAIYRSLGYRDKTLNLYTQALPLYREINDRKGEAVMLHEIGRVFASSGAREKGLEFYRQALTLFGAIGDLSGEATTLNSIGASYDSLGDVRKALLYYNRALPLRRVAGDRGGEAVTLNNIGKVYYSIGEPQKALEYYNQALALNRAVEDHHGETVTLTNIGVVYGSLGATQKALEFHLQALAIIRAGGNRQDEAGTLHNIGVAYSMLGEEQKALDFYYQALPLMRKGGDRSGEATTLANIAGVQRILNNFTEAIARIEEAIRIFESLRSQNTSQELRASYFASVREFYQFYIFLLMQLHQQHPLAGHDGAALQASERGRARSLLETLSEAKADIRDGVQPQLLMREHSLQAQLNAKAEAQMSLLADPNKQTQAEAIAEEVENLTTEYEQTETEIRQKSPNYAALTQPQSLSVKEIQSQILDRDTLLLEYSLGEERSYVWAVTQDSIKSYELPKQAEIEPAARRLYELLNSRNLRVKDESPLQRAARVAVADGEIGAASRTLSQIVLAPVAAELGTKRLVIVADGVLQYIPFSTLADPTWQIGAAPQPLIVGHEIVSLPSASTLAVIRLQVAGRQPAPKMIAALADPVFMRNDVRLSRGVTVVADNSKEAADGAESVKSRQLVQALEDTGAGEGLNVPRLPGSRKEAETIVAIAPKGENKLALDFAASRELATSAELSQYRYVHFSTHGFLNSVHPELSGIVFSLVNEKGEAEDGFLRANEIYNLRLSAELVVLSACETGIGKEVKGEGLVSLTRGFMYAGAPRVVVSMWSVSDEGTGELMVRFYRSMLKDGLRPAAALRAAQISLMKEKRWASPYYWAPFVLQGEWR